MKEKDKPLVVHPPRLIKLGKQIDPMNGKEVGEFCLPFEKVCGVNIIMSGQDYSVFAMTIIEGLRNKIIGGIEPYVSKINFKRKCYDSMASLIVNHPDTHTIFFVEGDVSKDIKENLKSLIIIDVMKVFTLGSGEKITGDLAKVHVVNMPFMPAPDIFLVAIGDYKVTNKI